MVGINDLPKKLYRYRKLDGIHDDEWRAQEIDSILSKGAFIPSGLHRMNDLLEFPLCLTNYAPKKLSAVAKQYDAWLTKSSISTIVSLAKSGHLDMISSEMRKLMMERFSILCVSESVKSPMLWGLYGDSGKGICIEIDTKSVNIQDDHSTGEIVTSPDMLENGFHKVRYSNTRPKMELWEYICALNERAPGSEYSKKFVDFLFIKSDEWMKEAEYRVAFRGEANCSFVVTGTKNVFIGPAVSPDNKDLAQLIAKYPGHNYIKTKASPSKYAIIQDR